MRLQTVCCDHKTSCSDTTRTPQSYSIYNNNNNSSIGNNINYTILNNIDVVNKSSAKKGQLGLQLLWQN